MRSVCAELRREGISVVGVQSELFSHRDKNYTRNRLKELTRQTITGDNRLEMELKGCGFTEALYALVEQVMEPSAQIPHSINIETVGWGSEGKAALRELEVFLNGCGIQVNTWIPSAPLSSLVHAPAAELNLVKRVRWARRMREKFGTAYLHIGGAGRYAGLDGICTFYRDGGGPPPPGAGPGGSRQPQHPAGSLRAQILCAGLWPVGLPSLCHPDPGEP